MDLDLVLCDDCGRKFDALASACEALGEDLTVETMLPEFCATCLAAFRLAVGL